MIQVTELAQKQLEKILPQNQNYKIYLRVFVSQGGCSGFSYGMKFDKVKEDDNALYINDNLSLAVDPYSAQFLKEAEIDYIDSLMGGGFTVYNPNAVSTCSCGQSFNTDIAKSTPKPCAR